MGVKKQKRTRRVLRFYKTCYGFREPFKVLCDGNFVHLVLRQRMGSLHDTVPALLGGSAKVFVTRCILTELKKLGEDFDGTVIAARRLNIAKCNHDPVHSASDCLEEMIGAANVEHFFVATQDLELRQKLRKVPGAALIFLHSSGLVLEPPSSFQVAHTRRQEAVLGSNEYKSERGSQKVKERLQPSAHQRDPESVINLSNIDHQPFSAVTLDEDNRSGAGPSDTTSMPRPKRKRAKGPNPLSFKKRKELGGKDEQVSNLPASDSKEKRSRQRRRPRKKDMNSSSLQGAQ